MFSSDRFFVLVFALFAADIVGPRLYQLRAWYVERFYEDEEEEDDEIEQGHVRAA